MEGFFGVSFVPSIIHLDGFDDQCSCSFNGSHVADHPLVGGNKRAVLRERERERERERL